MIYRTAAMVCLLALAATAPGTVAKSIHVEWGYTPPSEPAVTGFKLYQEGVLVCNVSDPEARCADCDVILDRNETSFTLTAAFSDGTESPHSAPFPYSMAIDSRSPARPVLKSVLIE